MERLICENCGESLLKQGDFYTCRYCGASYREDIAERSKEALENVLKEYQIENLAKARRNLYEATHAKYPSRDSVLSYARAVLLIHPEDFLARVYLYSDEGDPYQLNQLLTHSNVSAAEAKEAHHWLLACLKPRFVASYKDFISRHFKGKELTDALTALEKEAANIDAGIYVSTLPRTVFVAHSSKDNARVVEIVNFLEENGFSCWTSERNLRHGLGAKENYKIEIEAAMKSCKVFLFLSSNASRSVDCDAITVELPHLISDLPKKPRIEYILDDYPERIPLSVKKTLKDAFPTQEHCRGEEDLYERVNLLRHAEENAEKEKAKKIAEAAAEEARKQLEAEYAAKEEARRKLEEERLKTQAEKEEARKAKEEALRAEAEAKERELEEARLALEREKLELEKKKLAASSSSSTSFNAPMDEEGFLAMMEKAQKAKKERELAEEKRRKEEDLKARAFHLEGAVIHYGKIAWTPLSYDEEKGELRIIANSICFTRPLNDGPITTKDPAKMSLAAYLKSTFLSEFPDNGKYFASLPYIPSKEDVELLPPSQKGLQKDYWTCSEAPLRTYTCFYVVTPSGKYEDRMPDNRLVGVRPIATLQLDKLGKAIAEKLVPNWKEKQEEAQRKRLEAEALAAKQKAIEEEQKRLAAIEAKKRQLQIEAENAAIMQDYEAKYPVGTTLSFGMLPQGEDATWNVRKTQLEGKEKPIEWLVLSNNVQGDYVWLIAKSILMIAPKKTTIWGGLDAEKIFEKGRLWFKQESSDFNDFHLFLPTRESVLVAPFKSAIPTPAAKKMPGYSYAADGYWLNGYRSYMSSNGPALRDENKLSGVRPCLQLSKLAFAKYLAKRKNAPIVEVATKESKPKEAPKPSVEEKAPAKEKAAKKIETPASNAPKKETSASKPSKKAPANVADSSILRIEPSGVATSLGGKDPSSIKKVIVSASVTKIDPKEFDAFTSLKEFEVEPRNQFFETDSGMLCRKHDGDLTVIVCPQAYPKSVVKLGSSGYRKIRVRNIAARAFYRCVNIQSIAFNSSVLHFECPVFQECPKLRYIHFDQFAETIDAPKPLLVGCQNGVKVFFGIKKPLLGFPRGYDRNMFKGIDVEVTWNASLYSVQKYFK